jgi:hypothetical protein
MIVNQLAQGIDNSRRTSRKMKRKRERKQTFNLIVNTREAMVRLDIHSPSNRFEKLGLVASGELRFGL